MFYGLISVLSVSTAAWAGYTAVFALIVAAAFLKERCALKGVARGAVRTLARCVAAGDSRPLQGIAPTPDPSCPACPGCPLSLRSVDYCRLPPPKEAPLPAGNGTIEMEPPQDALGEAGKQA